jgi:hypothetical protein
LKNPEIKCLEVAETLSSVLQTITVGDVPVHASGELSGKQVDGNLQFTVTYTIYAMKDNIPVDNMEILEQTVAAVE